MDAPPIPSPVAEDDEDVHWALSTASALWSRGERAEALKWLRRAAETASDANADARALELFKAAAEVATKLSVVPPPDEPPRTGTPPPPAATASSVAPSVPRPAPAVTVHSPRTAVSPGGPPPPPSSPGGSGTGRPPPARTNPAKSTVTLASPPAPSGAVQGARSGGGPQPLVSIAVTAPPQTSYSAPNVPTPSPSSPEPLVAPPLVPRDPRPQSVRSGNVGSGALDPSGLSPAARSVPGSPAASALAGGAKEAPATTPHPAPSSALPSTVAATGLGSLSVGGGTGAPSRTSTTAPKSSQPRSLAAHTPAPEGRRGGEEATRAEPMRAATRETVPGLGRPVDDEVTIQKDFSLERDGGAVPGEDDRRPNEGPGAVRFDDLEEETKIIPGRQQLGRVLLAVDPFHGASEAGERGERVLDTSAGAGDSSSASTDPEATPEGENYEAVIAAAAAASAEASRAAPVDAVPSTVPAAAEAASVVATRVAVLGTAHAGEVRVVPLSAESAAPPGSAVAILVPLSRADATAIASLFGAGEPKRR